MDEDPNSQEATKAPERYTDKESLPAGVVFHAEGHEVYIASDGQVYVRETHRPSLPWKNVDLPNEIGPTIRTSTLILIDLAEWYRQRLEEASKSA